MMRADSTEAIRSKQKHRRKLADLSEGEKLQLLDKLRERRQTQKGKKRSAASTNDVHQFGGRGAAAGTNYEVSVGAFLAIKMLCGNRCIALRGPGSDISAITMQARQHVDDIVIDARNDSESQVFISAKKRSASIALSQTNGPFRDTIESFVRQFLALSSSQRENSRMVWVVPSSAGRKVTQDLAGALETHRQSADDDSLEQFLSNRSKVEQTAVTTLLKVARSEWERTTNTTPADDDLRAFLRQIYVEVMDFHDGAPCRTDIEENIRTHLASSPEDAPRIWGITEQIFKQVNEKGLRMTSAKLRSALTSHGFVLRARPDFAQDTEMLRVLTEQNLRRLREHSTLSFGPQQSDQVHIERAELANLLSATKEGDLLVTGEPGCGKSGLLHDLVGTLRKSGASIILLLAEDSLPPLAHPLDEILLHWPDGRGGILVTDALDAVRDTERQRATRRLLRDVKEADAGWRIVGSVREFDLKHSQELRELFAGKGVPGYCHHDFQGVAHFHVPRLSEASVDELGTRRPELQDFITQGRRSSKAGGIYRSLFHLRVAAELLRHGASPTLLSDWHSPALLMMKFWELRVTQGSGAADRETALRAICAQMVEARRMTVSLKELSLPGSAREQVEELRSRGILQAPALRYGTQVGGDEIRFAHHILHDYAIAKSLMPETAGPFHGFTIREPLLPVFYRQSFIFALEEFWDRSETRKEFWDVAFSLESIRELHSITRIVAPSLAARRLSSMDDVRILLAAVGTADDPQASSSKALRHLAASVQDIEEAMFRSSEQAWGELAAALSALLPAKPWTEEPLVQIISRLNDLGGSGSSSLNIAGRNLLAHHLRKGKRSEFAARTAITALCRTFPTAPAETETALMTLLAPGHLAEFPHSDLYHLAHGIKDLPSGGEAVVLKLCEAAFYMEPPSGQWEQRGSAILGLRVQTSDEWQLIRHVIANYYEFLSSNADPELLMAIPCIAWNGVAQRRRYRADQEDEIVASIRFRGVQCDLREDYSHIWSREFEHEENRILSHFETLLRYWAERADADRLKRALDCFAQHNRTSLMWSVLFETGAANPKTLGSLMAEALSDPVLLTHADYAYAAVELLGALHRAGDRLVRERLETLVGEVVNSSIASRDEYGEEPPKWVVHAQNRALGALQLENIITPEVRALWLQRQAEAQLPANMRPEGGRVFSHTYSEEELVERKGVDLEKPNNKEMMRLRLQLQPLLGRDGAKVSAGELEGAWPLIEESESVVEKHRDAEPIMASELWGHLIGACDAIVCLAEWEKDDARWVKVRRILLKASIDKVPEPLSEDAIDHNPPSWGWPAPRVDAAHALPLLVHRLGTADREVAEAVRRLARDESHPVRFNLARRLAVLEKAAPDLMWELMDILAEEERNMSVLDAVAESLNWLWRGNAAEVKPRLHRIARHAREAAPIDHRIHATLAGAYLFRHLRIGDPDCETYVQQLIQECDREPAARALRAQLHGCRAGGWLTAGNPASEDAKADAARSRTWKFFSELLDAAQAKLAFHRAELGKLEGAGRESTEAKSLIQGKIDRTFALVDAIAMQLYFASGGCPHAVKDGEGALTGPQTRRFWQEAAPLLSRLASEEHPHTAHQLIETLDHLLPYAPREVFMLAAKTIRSSAHVGFQYESLAVNDVVKLVERALADHREIFQRNRECLQELLAVLDLFVEAGWAAARQLPYRLEEIYR